MFRELGRSITLGLIVAVVVLFLLPYLRSGETGLHSSAFNPLTEQPMNFSAAVRRASPAVVNVYNRSSTLANESTIRNLGSGVIMSEKGYILTNKHVINDAEQIIVALQDSRIFEAQLVGSDSLTDLAVLRIDATSLPVISINPKRTIHVGDVVLAIGNPYNLGQTITQGIISATGRSGLSPSGRQNFLQTDASINRGNSGGALVNTLGELVGINTLSLEKIDAGDAAEGIGFAIPIELASKVMDKLIRDGRVIRGYVGIEGKNAQFQTATQLINNSSQGVIVTAVNPIGPAYKVGIRPGDLILSVNEKPVVSILDTIDQITELPPGQVIPIQILREGKELELQITIMEYPTNN